MKKLLSLVICVMTIITVVTACIPAASGAGFYATAELLKLKDHIENDAGMNIFATVQGACTDGKYAYFAVQQGSTKILKYRMKTWERAGKAKKVNGLGHANDMAYNSKEKYIVVANNYASDDILTIVDPKKLEVIGSVEPKREKTEKEIEKEAKKKKVDASEIDRYKRIKVYSIAYNAKRDQYVAGISGTYDFALLNSNFEVVERFGGISTGYTRQGCDCDNDYIYFSQSGGKNTVAVYDYDGRLVDTVSLGHSHEVENIFHVDKYFYTTLHYYGNSVHRVGLSKSTQIRYRVDYKPGEGTGKMKSTVVHYGKETPLRANSFTRPGYFFGGWRASRTSDGKHLGYRKFSDEREWLRKKDVYRYDLYKDKESVCETVKFGNVVMTPFWISENYNIRYDPGDAEGMMPDTTTGYFDSYVIPENGYVKDGYVFTGFTAYRDYDNKYYGYRKKSKAAEWLEESDVAKYYEFQPGNAFSRMTYDGEVVLTPVFRFAYTYNKDKTVLKEYIDLDETVYIPNPDNKLHTIAEGAFCFNSLFTEIHIPATVDCIQSEAIHDCDKLKRIYFEDNFPSDFADDSVVRCNSPAVILKYGNKTIPLGYAARGVDSQILAYHAASAIAAMSQIE